jgi:CheY-like chemotaxis protein
MSRSSVLVVAPKKELQAWEDVLRARGHDVTCAASPKEASAAVAQRSPSAVLVSEKLPLGGALRLAKEFQKHPATQQTPVVMAGIAPLTVAQRVRLGPGAPDATVKRGATAEEVADAVAAALEKGKLPPLQLTPQQQSGMKYSRIGNMMMVFGVIFSMPGLGGGAPAPGASDNKSWFLLLVPLGGLVADYATGLVDQRKKLLTWQGWAAIAMAGIIAVAILVWPDYFAWPTRR